MMSEDLKLNLERCYTWEPGKETCKECPYYELEDCFAELMKDARMRIEELEAAVIG